MKELKDYEGRIVRFSQERLAHVLSHPELTEHEDWVTNTLLHPEEVRYSISDRMVKLFYRFYPNTKVGNKWLCVVAKYLDDDAFVITAYLTDKFKRGDSIWPNP